MNLQELHDASCSDGNCVFKITPEMRKGMRTNGGCCCLKDMRYGIGHNKTIGVMALSQIASEAEAEIAKGERLLVAAIEKRDMEILSLEAEIARLRKALKSITSGCYTRETAAIIAIDALQKVEVSK